MQQNLLTPGECSHPPEAREVAVYSAKNGEKSAIDFCNECSGYV